MPLLHTQKKAATIKPERTKGKEMAKKENIYSAEPKTYHKYVERIYDVKVEIKELNNDIREIKNEAVANGCDARILNNLVRIRTMKVVEKDALESALEM